jgi:hypothetical protein
LANFIGFRGTGIAGQMLSYLPFKLLIVVNTGANFLYYGSIGFKLTYRLKVLEN